MKTIDEVLSDADCRLALSAMLKACLGKDKQAQYSAIGDFLATLQDPEPEISLPEPMKQKKTEDVPRETKPKKGGRPKGSKNKKAEPLTKEDVAFAKAHNAAAIKPDPDAVLAAAIDEVVKPNLNDVKNDGFRHIRINLIRHGQSVPTSGHKWVQALRSRGIPVDEKMFTCIAPGLNGVPKNQIELRF